MSYTLPILNCNFHSISLIKLGVNNLFYNHTSKNLLFIYSSLRYDYKTYKKHESFNSILMVHNM